MHPLRLRLSRGLDVLAVIVVLAAIVRLGILPRLHRDVVQAPPVSLAALDGGRFDLERRRGRLVFLEFWTTWCGPCKDAIPLVQRFHRRHPEIDVVSVDVGEPVWLVRQYAAKLKMDHVVLDPDMTVAHAFGVTGYPTLVAIDAAGRVRASWSGFNPDIESEMSDAVKKYGAAVKTANL
ncbi:MAG TPA: TlpA disulfide reductase family protein [Candidatus Elarobacter sp.]|jgi:thiol-disulfide isomerase/thioredoxin